MIISKPTVAKLAVIILISNLAPATAQQTEAQADAAEPVLSAVLSDLALST